MMQSRQPSGAVSRSRGFTLLELAIVVCVIAVLAAFAVDRMIGLEVDAERVQMQRVVATLRSAARMEMAEIIIHDDKARLARLHGANPMALLEEPPPNYKTLSDTGDDGEAIAQPGTWFFRDGYLIYRVDNTRYFESEGPPGQVRFRLNVRYEDENGDGRFTPGKDHPRALVVENVDRYRWLREPVVSAVSERQANNVNRLQWPQ